MDDVLLLRVGMRDSAIGLNIESTGVNNVVIDTPSLIYNNYIDILDPYNKLVNQLKIQQSGQIEMLKSSTWKHSTQTTGLRPFQNIITELLSMARGKIVETSSGVYDLYGSDNTTVLYTLTHAGNARNVS